MDDKNRPKILGLGLVAVVAVFMLRSTVDGIVMKPIRDISQKLKSAQDEGDKLADKEQELRFARAKLGEWQSMSMPENPDDARRLYREWILELTRQSGFGGTSFDVSVGASRGQMGEIAVDISKAETDLAGLARFLYLFDQANLLQRISSLNIDSQGTQGKPRLLVSFTAQALHVGGDNDMSSRSELFPRTALTSEIAESATTIAAKASESFELPEPFEPFMIRVERELMRVDAVAESGWTVTRGMNQTKPVAHGVDAVVELFPINWDRREVSIDAYTAYVESSPFVIPSPPKSYNPRLGGVADKTIKLGEELTFTARAENYDPEKGEPQFALEEAADGMTIDPESGEFAWTPGDSVASGVYTATVLLTQPGNPDVKLSSKLTVTIKQPNLAPVVTVADSVTVVIGREFTLGSSATDDGPASDLKFSLGTGSPEGMTIDASTGQLKWTPAASFTPGKYDVTVTVTDAGEEPMSGTKKVSLDVQDDGAALTVLTAAISNDGVWRAWFRNKGTDKTDILKAGDRLKVSEIDAALVEISSRWVTLRDNEGLWKLSLGDMLRERKLIEPAAAATPATEPPKSGEAYEADPPAATAPATGEPATGTR